MPGADSSRLQGLAFTGMSCLFTVTTAGGNQLANLEGVMGQGYEEKRTRPIIYGSRRDGRPLGKGAGRYEPGMLTMDVEEATADLITDALASESDDDSSFGDVDFDVQIQLYEPSKQVGLIAMNFTGCNVDSEKGDYPNTPDGLKKSFGFSFLAKFGNGKTLFSQTRTT
jgi:hypothetical protein